MKEEIWKDVPNYEGYYQISSYGRVRSIDRFVLTKRGNYLFVKGRYMTPQDNGHGYLFVSFRKSGYSKQFYVHRLVGFVFLGLCEHDSRMQIDHLNMIKSDNRVCNLEVVTHHKNIIRKSLNTSENPEDIGVLFLYGKWHARIGNNGKTIEVGVFDDKEDARRAYWNAFYDKESGKELVPYKAQTYSGVVGVSFNKNVGKWQAYLNRDKIIYHIGYYESIEEASEERDKAIKFIENGGVLKKNFKREKTSKYVGVGTYREGRWRARYNNVLIGYFNTEEEAKIAREKYMLSLK